jgi:hypothetical protein
VLTVVDGQPRWHPFSEALERRLEGT